MIDKNFLSLPIEVEIIPLGGSKEISCGPDNVTQTWNLTPGTTYIYTCLDPNNVETILGAYACGVIGGAIVIQRVPPGLKAVLKCGGGA
ncbi:hypothetical protein [Shouchella lonarensis]|uniref:Uncharacterized protein n=1 Tax=Shouchella lonarensis TaxID=1464122 RepID=A0A1G6GNB6_9BACI|nr:hypothetical protein [Shouchella lonarensis]SDB83492.1 hypothetical protein SAMN05421737_101289 [Shouchella lonarensis]